MKNLSVKVNCNFDEDIIVLVDGKKVKLKKDNYGNLNKTISVSKNSAEISIYNFNEMKSKLWFFTSLIFFIVSIFGILDIRTNKNCQSKECKFKVNLDKEDNEIKIHFNKFEKNSTAVNFESNCELEVISNRCYIDCTLKKRFKIMKFVKITTFILSAILLILLVK